MASPSQKAAKISEGDSLMKEADKLASKTLFKWKADYDGAGPIYERAGVCYRNGQAYERAKLAFLKAADCQVKGDLGYAAGKSYDNASEMCKQIGQTEEAANYLIKASEFYRLNNSQEKSAETLVKAAKLLEDKDIDKSIQLCKDAIENLDVDDKNTFTAPIFKTATSLCIKNKRIEEAIELYKKQSQINSKLNHENDLWKSYISVITLHLYQDDFVAADKAWQDYSMTAGFVGSKEGKVAATMIDAFQKRDNESLKNATKQQVFDFVDNELAKLARKMNISGNGPIGGSKGYEEDDDPNSLA